MRYLSGYAILDTSRRKGLARAMKWNDMPFCEHTDPDVKGLEFDLQVAENGGDPNVTHRNPYPEDDE